MGADLAVLAGFAVAFRLLAFFGLKRNTHGRRPRSRADSRGLFEAHGWAYLNRAGKRITGPGPPPGPGPRGATEFGDSPTL